MTYNWERVHLYKKKAAKRGPFAKIWIWKDPWGRHQTYAQLRFNNYSSPFIKGWTYTILDYDPQARILSLREASLGNTGALRVRHVGSERQLRILSVGSFLSQFNLWGESFNWAPVSWDGKESRVLIDLSKDGSSDGE